MMKATININIGVRHGKLAYDDDKFWIVNIRLDIALWDHDDYCYCSKTLAPLRGASNFRSILISSIIDNDISLTRGLI